MIFKWKCSAFIVVNLKPFMRERLKANIKIRIFECGAHLWSFTPPGGAMRMMTVINKGGYACKLRLV